MFFQRLEVKDKQIAKVIYTPLFNKLLEAQRAYRVSSNWLTTPPFTLYQIFNRETIAKLKVQLEVARKLASNPLAYQVVEVTNGKFCQLPVQG